MKLFNDTAVIPEKARQDIADIRVLTTQLMDKIALAGASVTDEGHYRVNDELRKHALMAIDAATAAAVKAIERPYFGA